MTAPLVKYLAYFFSIVFHPVWMPLMGIFVLFHSGTYLTYLFSGKAKELVYLILFLNTVIFPISLTLYLYKKNIISHFTLHQQKERAFAYLGTLIFYLITLYFLLKINLPLLIIRFILGAIFVVLLCFFFNFFIKISAHMAGLGGITTSIFLLATKLNTPSLYPFFLFFILISGLVGSSRLILHQHNLPEIAMGYLIGIAGIWFSF